MNLWKQTKTLKENTFSKSAHPSIVRGGCSGTFTPEFEKVFDYKKTYGLKQPECHPIRNMGKNM